MRSAYVGPGKLQDRRLQMTRASNGDHWERLVADGRLLYNSIQLMVELRDDLRSWVYELGVRVEFSPETPPDIHDYLAAGSLAAIEGAFAGGVFGLVLGTVLGSPAVGLGLGVGFGSIVGAAVGTNSVSHGLRVRVDARRSEEGFPIALVEVL